VTTGSALANLTEPKLRAWILARMREEQVNPPIAESRLESPDDYVQAVYAMGDEKFRARIKKAVLSALDKTAEGHLISGADARAIRNLAALVDGLEFNEAASTLQAIAERGAFGGNPGRLDPDAEEMVLFALAGIQPQKKLWAQWFTLWKRDILPLWPVVTAGLRLSDGKRALAILPLAVQRAAKHADFPLDEVLWAFATDDRFDSEEIAEAFEGLTPDERARCREALREIGAEPDEIEEWLPEEDAPDSDPLPWMNKSSIMEPARVSAFV
jgi:hypothetical protein